MTREELKAHCEKQIKLCEMWAKHNGEEPSGKVYEEHKLILELLEQEPQIGHCKDCKYFEYDSVAKVKVDGISLIVSHAICSRWSDGCKTREDGYCFLFEPQEGSAKE